MYHSFFIHSSVNGHLGCFHVLASLNRASMNIEGTCVFFQFWLPQGICPGMGLLGPMVVLFLVFQGIFILFSIMILSIYIPTNSAKGFPFLHTLFSIYRFFDDGHSDWYEVTPHCSFDLHFSDKE